MSRKSSVAGEPISDTKATPAAPDRATRKFTWVVAGLIAIFLALTFSESRLLSPTSDEPPHIAAGLSYFVTHNILRADPVHPPLLKELSALSMMAAGIRWPHTAASDYLVNGDDPERVYWQDWTVGNEIIRQNGPDRALFWARLPMILVGALLALLLYLWGRQLLGSAAAAGAVFLLVTDPIIVGHSQLVNTDIGAAAFSILALFALWNYMRRPGWKSAVLTGLALGLALGAKYSAIVLLPIFVLLAATAIWTRRGRKWPAEDGLGSPQRATRADGARPMPRKSLCWCGSGKRYKNCHGATAAPATLRPDFAKLGRMAAGPAILCVVAFLLVQALFFFPSDLLIYKKCAELVNADHDASYMPFIAGELLHHSTSYFLVAYLLKEPLASILLAAVGMWSLFRNKSTDLLGKAFLLVPPAAFFLAVTVMAENIGVRYIIPALPFLHLLGGLGLVTLFRAKLRWARWVGVLLCGWLVLAVAGIYPDHLSYFNEAACALAKPGQIGLDGGSRCGVSWLDDSNVDWGQGLRELKAWLDSHAPNRPVKLATTYIFPAEAYGIACEHIDVPTLMKEPQPGLYAVSAHLVARVPLYGGSDWLRRRKPTAIVGHSLYIYDISR